MTTVAFEYGAARKLERPASPRVKVVRGGRYGSLAKARQALHTAAWLFAAALVLGLIVSVIYSQARITALSGEIGAAQSELTAEQSRYDYLSSVMSDITSRASVQDVAEGELGFVKADNSQITYVRLEEQSVLQKNAGGAPKLIEGLRAAALDLLDILDP